jgi:hypothetical protein
MYPFELALSALFRRVSRVSFSIIALDYFLFFGVENFVLKIIVFDDKDLLM